MNDARLLTVFILTEGRQPPCWVAESRRPSEVRRKGEASIAHGEWAYGRTIEAMLERVALNVGNWDTMGWDGLGLSAMSSRPTGEIGARKATGALMWRSLSEGWHFRLRAVFP